MYYSRYLSFDTCLAICPSSRQPKSWLSVIGCSGFQDLVANLSGEPPAARATCRKTPNTRGSYAYSWLSWARDAGRVQVVFCVCVVLVAESGLLLDFTFSGHWLFFPFMVVVVLCCGLAQHLAWILWVIKKVSKRFVIKAFCNILKPCGMIDFFLIVYKKK